MGLFDEAIELDSGDWKLSDAEIATEDDLALGFILPAFGFAEGRTLRKGPFAKQHQLDFCAGGEIKREIRFRGPGSCSPGEEWQQQDDFHFGIIGTRAED
jgi:hypothetical protein